MFSFLKNKAKRFDCEILEINGVSNHLHSIISIPPTVTISDIVGKLKGSSSYFLNKELNLTTYFRWQSGYGVLTISEKDLPRVISYIQNQKQHHSEDKTNEYLENCGEDD